MRLIFAVSASDESPVHDLRDELVAEPELRDARVRLLHAAPEPGTLGAAEVLEFIGQDVLLPVVIQAVYDWFQARRRARPGGDTTVTVTLTDSPDGTREVKIEASGTAEDVIAVLRQGLR
ncbi:effector-associated constant component EACC1 [Micromonospora matsumotoense]|uniref:effector-associated constant component EACC1 n=1 Tax=Micromonospora matsumotoense TaxID=121616 RepID=UPI00340B182A